MKVMSKGPAGRPCRHFEATFEEPADHAKQVKLEEPATEEASVAAQASQADEDEDADEDAWKGLVDDDVTLNAIFEGVEDTPHGTKDRIQTIILHEFLNAAVSEGETEAQSIETEPSATLLRQCIAKKLKDVKNKKMMLRYHPDKHQGQERQFAHEVTTTINLVFAHLCEEGWDIDEIAKEEKGE